MRQNTVFFPEPSDQMPVGMMSGGTIPVIRFGDVTLQLSSFELEHAADYLRRLAVEAEALAALVEQSTTHSVACICGECVDSERGERGVDRELDRRVEESLDGAR